MTAKKTTPAKPAELAVPVAEETLRIAALEEQVSFLLKGRPGRKYLPILVSEPHVCGVDPTRDPKACQDASLWRRNKGCQGDACMQKSSEYYKTYRKAKTVPKAPKPPKTSIPQATPVPKPRKRRANG